MSDWSDKWPTKDGYYWCYGAYRGECYHMHVVRVLATKAHFDGIVLSERDYEGIWLPIEQPPTPPHPAGLLFQVIDDQMVGISRNNEQTEQRMRLRRARRELTRALAKAQGDLDAARAEIGILPG